MPEDPDTGKLRPFTDDEIDAMEIRTFGVRDFTHGMETRKVGDNTLRKSFHVKWSERFNFCERVCGNEKTYVDGTGHTKLSRLLPDEKYGTHYPNFPEIIATRIDGIKGANGPGIDDEDGVVGYPDAQVDVFYEHVPYDLAEDDATASELQRYTFFNSSQGSAEHQRPGRSHAVLAGTG
ncbi:unnamed protein product [Gemmata massiliana]|uniref:Uncharacterized protein n=1 Tax=Gemmata massiliana TaxID=1210884 RepID=A0A6P2D9B6_9BACT|nr:hypothetical protein [Gemmata massiliana]VTR97941.1 unnamed protein product [Gemmata massiliana]